MSEQIELKENRDPTEVTISVEPSPYNNTWMSKDGKHDYWKRDGLIISYTDEGEGNGKRRKVWYESVDGNFRTEEVTKLPSGESQKEVRIPDTPELLLLIEGTSHILKTPEYADEKNKDRVPHLKRLVEQGTENVEWRIAHYKGRLDKLADKSSTE